MTTIHVTPKDNLATILARKPRRVVLHGGRYELKRPLLIRHPVTLCAAPGERPVISGARQLGPWRAEGDRLVCDLPGSCNPLQLFVDGKRAERARLPKKGWLRIAGTFGKSRPADTPWGNGPDEVEYRDGDLPAMRNLEDVRWVGMGSWFEMPMRIVAQDTGRQSLLFHRQTWSRLMDEKREWCRYRVENVAEALSEPGEWYHDRPAGKLFYIPLPGQTAENITAFAPQVDRLVHVRGADGVTFENITFQHCDWHPPENYRGSIQAGHLIPGAILFEQCAGGLMYGCEVSQVGGYGVELGIGSHDCRVVGCTLHDLGGGGVRVDHEWLEAHSKEVVGDPVGVRGKERPRAAVITDCRIHHGARLHYGAVGIYVGNASHCRLMHNDIFEMRYSGISVGWMWFHGPTATVDNRIEFNHVHDLNREEYLSDLGCIYTLGCQPGSSVRNNHLHHIYRHGYGGNGIYPDAGSSGILFENNIAHHCVCTGFGGGQRDVVVRNNIFAITEEFTAQPGNNEETFATWFERNVMFWREGTLGNQAPVGSDPNSAVWTGNVLWPAGRPLQLSDGHDLAYWQQRGQFADTLIADPLFVDPDGGDYRLRADSPAIRHGFKPIDISRCGPRKNPPRREKFAERPILFARMDQLDADRIRVRIHNPGRLPASGVWRLRVPTGGTVILSEAKNLSCSSLKTAASKRSFAALRMTKQGTVVRVTSMPRGAELLLEGSLQSPAGVHRIELWPNNRHWTPAAVIAETGAPRWTLRRDGAAEEETLTHNGQTFGRFKLAVEGDRLRVWARLRDAKITRAPINSWWDGSCFEIYIAPGYKARPVQVALLADPGLVIRMEDWFTVPKPEIPVDVTPTGDGYEIAASLPLELFYLKPDATHCRLEITAGIRLAGEAKDWVKLTRFAAPAPNHYTRGMASVTVQ